MDIQAMFDAMSASMRTTRSDYHVTLGELITDLDGVEGLVLFEDGNSPGNEDSYRGYYADLAFGQQLEPKLASEFFDQCRRAFGKTYEGYKGGDFVMDEDTPLWRAAYGDTGDAIVNTKRDGDNLILICKQID